MNQPVLTFFDFSHPCSLFMCKSPTGSSEVPHWSLRFSETNKGQSSLYPLGIGQRQRLSWGCRISEDADGQFKEIVWERQSVCQVQLQFKTSGCVSWPVGFRKCMRRHFPLLLKSRTPLLIGTYLSTSDNGTQSYHLYSIPTLQGWKYLELKTGKM